MLAAVSASISTPVGPVVLTVEIISIPGILSLRVKSKLILVTGTSGTGKTTISAKIASSIMDKFGRNNIVLAELCRNSKSASEDLKSFARLLNIPITNQLKNGDLSDTMILNDDALNYIRVNMALCHANLGTKESRAESDRLLKITTSKIYNDLNRSYKIYRPQKNRK